jgi:hypothetical protein
MAALALPAEAVVVADAGDDVHVECEGPRGAEVTLDGSASTPNADLLWEARGVAFDAPDAVSPTAFFPPGITTVSLTATLGVEADVDHVDVFVEDRSPPVARGLAFPSVLWPPNHRLVEVHVRLRVGDRCAPEPEVRLVSATSSEPDESIGDGNTTGDIQGADLGTDDRSVWLRAERSGTGPGRVYLLTYRISDGAGNHTFVTVPVRVPHDQSGVRPEPEDGPDDALGEICPLPSEAAVRWSDELPDPSALDHPRACLSACQSWEGACQGIAAGAHGCVAAEARGREGLERVRCMGLLNARERLLCLRELMRDRSEVAGALRGDLMRARGLCSENGLECRDDCAHQFE